MARTFNNNTANRLTNASTLGITNWPLTLACWAKPVNNTQNNGLICFGDASASTPYLYLWLDGGTSGDPLRVGTVNPTVLGVNSSNAYNVGSWNSCVGIYENTQRTAWLNGTKTTGTVSSMAWPTGLDVTGVGLLERSGRAIPMNGDIAWAAGWDVVLTDDEAAAYCKGVHPFLIRPERLVAFWPLAGSDGAEPDLVGGYTLTEDGTVSVAESRALIPPRRAQIFVPKVAAGGGVTLSIDDATHGHTADGVSLTQQHQLAVQDASHAHTVDNLALTQAHQLAVADAAHAHSADNVTLSTEITLSIADALHGHSVDNITLVQQHVLAVDDATHGHSADNVVLATGTNLAIADALHGHTVDNLVLTQQHVLVVADAFHQHSADNVVLGGLPVAAVEEGGGGPDREESEQPAERFTKDGSGWRKPKWVQEREQLEAAAVTKPAEKPVAPVDEREALIASAKASDALAASLERVQPPIIAPQDQAVAAPAQQTAAVDFERARIAAKVRQQREIEEIMTVLMMAA